MTVRAIHHLGLVVQNLDTAVDFYAKAFGFVETGKVGWTTAPGKKLGIRVDEVDLRWAFIELEQTVVELHEFRGIEQQPIIRQTQDYGLGHLAFEVTDIDNEMLRLSKLGIQFFGDPNLLHGPLQGGDQWVYGRDPHGLLIEIYQPATS